MCNFIGMEYLVALAFIEKDVDEISLSDLNTYGINVIKIFKEEDINAVFLFSDEYTLELVKNYSDCFALIKNGTILKRKVRLDVLLSKFLSYLSTDILLAVSKRKCEKQ